MISLCDSFIKPVQTAMSRSVSETGIWARFRRSTNNCMNMSRSRTQEGLDKISENETRLSELNLSHLGKEMNTETVPTDGNKITVVNEATEALESDNELNVTVAAESALS